MNSRGWYVQPALNYEGSRENIHLSINASNVEWVDRFLEDLADSVEEVKDKPPGQITGLLKQNLAALNPGEMDEEAIEGLLSMAGIRGEGLPEQMAEINEVLNTLPAGFREKLLVVFVNDLFTPK
jgi:hypothetical protein